MTGNGGPDELLGRTLGGYRVESVIGRGGMGVVYRAVQIALRRSVALKVISPELVTDEGIRERFRRESELAAGLEHPHIVPIHEAGEVDGLLFVSMRYVDGTDLRATITREGALPPERAALIVSQVGLALDAAHARGLVHRDVKPANVLLGRSQPDHAYLTDFGVVKQLDATMNLTQSGQFVGTISYVAPEQLRGDAVDRRADVYSLGCVLHEALTGETPFGKRSAVALMYAHLNEEPRIPSIQRPGVAVAFDRCVATALSKDPDGRFATAGELGRCALRAAGTADGGGGVATGRSEAERAATAPHARPADPTLPVGPTVAAEPEVGGGPTEAVAPTAAAGPAAPIGPTEAAAHAEPDPGSAATRALPDAGSGATARVAPRRRPLLLAGLALAVAAAIVVVAVLLSSGSDDSGAAADTTAPVEVDRVDVGGPVTAIGHGAAEPVATQQFIGTTSGDVVRVDPKTRKTRVVANVVFPVQQILWGPGQQTLWIRARRGRGSSADRGLYRLDASRSGEPQRVSVRNPVATVVRPEGGAIVVGENGTGLEINWVDDVGKVEATRPLPGRAGRERIAGDAGRLFVADTGTHELSSFDVDRPPASGALQPLETVKLPGQPVTTTVGGVPRRLWILVGDAGERSVVAIDQDTLAAAGRPIAVASADGLANGDTTIYYYSRGPAAARPEIGQIDTSRLTLVEPRVPVANGIEVVASGAGYLWAGSLADGVVTRLR